MGNTPTHTRAEKGGGEKEKLEQRGRETDGEKVNGAGESGEEKRKGNAPKVSLAERETGIEEEC